MSGKIALIQLYAREEADQTFSLVIDTPASEGNVPVELGGGYRSIPDVQQAIIDALTSPAVAEDRLTALEDYKPKVEELIDAVNQQGEDLTPVFERLRALEDWKDAMDRSTPPSQRVQVRPRIEKPRGQGQPVPLRGSSGSRTVMVDAEETEPVQPPPGRPARPALDRPEPTWDRETVRPHVPVARVSRGPGSGS